MVDEKHRNDYECECNGDCDCDNEIVTLHDEDGNEHEFTIVDVLELDENKYAILMPIDEEIDEAIVLKFDIDENGDEILFEIESDEEWEAVVRAWEEFLDEE